EETLGYRRDGGHTARKDVGRSSTLQRRQVGFQPRSRWVGNTGVLIAFVLPQFLLYIGRCGKNRNNDSASGRIGLLSGMNGRSSESFFFLTALRATGRSALCHLVFYS